MKWSRDELDYLKREVPKGIPYREIADRLDRTVHSVEQKAHKLGLRAGRYWTRAEVTKLYELSENMSIREVAEELGRSMTSVNQKAFELGINFARGRGFISMLELAGELGVYRETVAKWLDQLGLLRYQIATGETRGHTVKKMKRAKGRVLPVSEEHVLDLLDALLSGEIVPGGRSRLTMKRVRDYKRRLLQEHLLVNPDDDDDDWDDEDV